MLELLERRFKANMHRHPDLDWADVLIRLDRPELLKTLSAMEDSGGEPDLVKLADDKYYFVDMAKESPKARQSLCYDEKARLARKKFPPISSAEQEASLLGVNLISEDDYFYIQSLESLDEKTSSWLFTEDDIRNLGGALFGTRRYNRTFIFFNGADSYYQGRGFRGKVAFDF